jgi:plasmid stability protein
MGEMTIRGIDDETLAVLRSEAEKRGVAPAEYALALLRGALPGGDRAAVARSILATQKEFSPISSVELLRQIRDQAE